ncbi:MAG: hypothetical protein AAB597_03360 [Patescibacteria group bacterium]
MLIWGIGELDLQGIAQQVGVQLVGPESVGRGLRFTLRPGDDRKWQRRSATSGRRINAVCFHGHKAFMEAVFALYPEARIKSVMADYRGVEEFNRQHEEVGDRNISNRMRPMSFWKACDCEWGPI